MCSRRLGRWAGRRSRSRGPCNAPARGPPLCKGLALAAAGEGDIGLYRRQAWVPVFNAGVQAWQGGQTDSAIASFRRANQIYKAEPMGFVYIANLFVGREEPDSASKKTDAAKYRTDSALYATRMDSAAKYFRLAV